MMDTHTDGGLLRIEQRDQALWIRMSEGSGVNEELTRVIRQVQNDPDIKAIVLTGAEEKSFCVGKGAADAPQTEAERNAYWVNGMRGARDLILCMLECDKPIIGRINGHAIGKGASIALCCDITVMVEDSKIGDTHVRVGLVAGDGGSLLWPALIGLMRSKRYLFTGDLLTGREAEALGLVTEAVSRDDLNARTGYWADRMAHAAPAAIAMTKRALNATLRQQASMHMDMSLGLETLSFLTQDHREGAAALSERREPRFSGR